MTFPARIQRPLALVILDGWGYAPRTESNAIALAHTPFYDEICRKYPMTTLAAAGEAIGQPADAPGNAEIGHLNLGTGRVAETEMSKIRKAIASGEFLENPVLQRAFGRAKETNAGIHLVGLLSDGGVHSSMDTLFALLRMAKTFGIEKVFIHAILDGLDVPERTADIYVEALEIKLADIGIGTIASLCGRFFAMDAGEHWERTARAFTMLVHAEGERTRDAVTSIRNSFLRGISDEFIAPIVVEKAPDVPVTTVKNGDLLVFFNHRADTMRQLVRSLCLPGGAGAQPSIDTVCMTEYDRSFNLPAAFRQEPEKNTLASVLSELQVPLVKITESARFVHLTNYFDGGDVNTLDTEQQVILSTALPAQLWPESQSFKIADRFVQALENSSNGVFVINVPAADLSAESGDLHRTVAAIRYIDTCLGGICEAAHDAGANVLVTSSHGLCEEIAAVRMGESKTLATANRVPLHFIDPIGPGPHLRENGSLADVAPTILGLLDIEKPAEMTGSDLRVM
ncbi:MAG: 2,3-bisphosphoglycerate-independent phosphoglycerate mutase [Acidobacteria bacterium]|nr:2,3-bisphosphoglycerate-independent phosphoglycerate mutase [Acidobacteriota bacterium]